MVETTSVVPDPIATDAANYAIEATETKTLHPIRAKLFIISVVAIILIGTFGAIIGTLNSVALKHQNALLKEQQLCQAQLLHGITEEQQARADISADDREAQLIFNHAITNATTQAQRNAALAIYIKQTKINDKARVNYPVPTFSNDVCDSKPGQVKVVSVLPTSTASVVPTSTSLHGGAITKSSTAGTTDKSSASSEHPSVPVATSSEKKNQSSPRATASTSASSSSSSAGLLPLPKCTVSIIGIKVC